MKKIILPLTALSMLSTNVYGETIESNLPDNYVSARDHFEELNYDIVWDGNSKSAKISNENMSFTIESKGLILWNDCVYFSDSALLYEDRLYICDEAIKAADMLNNAVDKNEESPLIVENMDKEDIEDLKGDEILHKFYNIERGDMTVSGAYYDNNTCSIMYEDDNNGYFIDFDSVSKNIISVERTINKSNYKNRSLMTNEKLESFTPKIYDFLKTFNNYENMEVVFYYIPNNNDSTVCTLLKDTENNYYIFEFDDSTLEPMAFHAYADINSAVNYINKYIK